jgi:hypothetical protein
MKMRRQPFFPLCILLAFAWANAARGGVYKEFDGGFCDGKAVIERTYTQGV